MNNEIFWLIRLGLAAQLFTREQALTVLKAVGREAQLMDFAQKLIDDSLVHDVEKLETLAGQAMARAAVGPPRAIHCWTMTRPRSPQAAPGPRPPPPAPRPAPRSFPLTGSAASMTPLSPPPCASC